MTVLGQPITWVALVSGAIPPLFPYLDYLIKTPGFQPRTNPGLIINVSSFLTIPFFLILQLLYMKVAPFAPIGIGLAVLGLFLGIGFLLRYLSINLALQVNPCFPSPQVQSRMILLLIINFSLMLIGFTLFFNTLTPLIQCSPTKVQVIYNDKPCPNIILTIRLNGHAVGNARTNSKGEAAFLMLRDKNILVQFEGNYNGEYIFSQKPVNEFTSWTTHIEAFPKPE